MENECSFRDDNNFSTRCIPLWDKYYQSRGFFNKIQQLRKRGEVHIKSIERDKLNPIFQAKTYLDVLITLDSGAVLSIDEKALRFNTIDYGCPGVVERWSNPKGKTDGWGYHNGTTIVQAYFTDKYPPKMITTPMVYNIDFKFIDEVTRNTKRYSTHTNKSTNGLYNSGFCFVPADVLNSYWP